MPLPSSLIWLLLAASIAAWAAPGPAAAVEAVDAASPDVGHEGAEADNPFAGRTFTTAREVVEMLLDEMGFGSVVGYARIDEPSPDAVTLDGVVLEHPADPSMRLGIGRVVVSDLDLAGLGTTAGPARFSIALEAIDYAAVARGLEDFGLVMLAEIDGQPTFTLAASLLPVAGGEGRMAARLLGQLDRQIGLSFEVTAQSDAGSHARPNGGDGPLGLMTFEEMPSDGVTVELVDWGFLGSLIEAQAASAGMAQGAFLAEAIEQLRTGLEPMEPGSPSAALYAAVSAMLADLDHPGVLRFAVTTDRPRPLEALFNALAEAQSMNDGDLRFAITYSRLP